MITDCAECGLPCRAEVCQVCLVRSFVHRDLMSYTEVIEELRERCMCAYCGEPADNKEHVIPRAYVGEHRFTVPSCWECNNLAGSRIFLTFTDKRDHVRRKLERKYKKLLKMPEWDRYELAEMDGNLRQALLDAEEARKLITVRLEFASEFLSLNR